MSENENAMIIGTCRFCGQSKAVEAIDEAGANEIATAECNCEEGKMFRKKEECLEYIMDICQATGNKHLLWFGNLLDTHFSGIIAHATYKISSGKIEGINQKIKTLRRHGYGYPDDEYFFLKIIDMSRKKYVRNEPSHRIYD